MSKAKGKEFLKVLGISALAIGLFTLGFVGINAVALAMSKSTTESLPPGVTSVVIPAVPMTPEDFAWPNVTVIADTKWNEPSANALGYDDVAMIGAGYIWAVFAECIDGTFITIRYLNNPSQTRTYWMGIVSGTELLFTFSIDAVTGDWIDISRSPKTAMNSENREVVAGKSHTDNHVYSFEMHRRGEQAPKQPYSFIQIAKESASRHFANTEVVSVEYEPYILVAISDEDENGNIIITSFQIMFVATDSTGRTAEVLLDELTGELFSITTHHNDFMPGFRLEDD